MINFISSGIIVTNPIKSNTLYKMKAAKSLISSCPIYYQIKLYPMDTKISPFRPNFGYFDILQYNFTIPINCLIL